MRQQPDLFTAPPAPIERAPPNLPYIRKSLASYLRTLREAVILPWGDSRTRSMAEHFVALARPLPDEEREALVNEFLGHLDRLGFRKAA